MFSVVQLTSKSSLGSGEMSQSVKCLPFKHEDLSADLWLPGLPAYICSSSAGARSRNRAKQIPRDEPG